MPLSAVIDDLDLIKPHLYEDSTWLSSTEASSWFSGTSSTVRKASPAEREVLLDFSFHGNKIGFYGTSSYEVYWEWQIDGGGLESLRTPIPGSPIPEDPYPSPLKVNNGLFSISGLRYNKNPVDHDMKLFLRQGGMKLDYILYEPSANRSVAGTTLLIDDQDEWINYSGTWNQSTNATFPPGFAMKGTITQTRTRGSSFKTEFVGSKISAYGALNSAAGELRLRYTIDGGNFSESVQIFDGTQEVNASYWELNQKLFTLQDYGLLSDEERSTGHTLEVTVEEISGDQVFSLDYLTFEGSPWTNVLSPGVPLATPLAVGGGSTTRKLAIGLGVALPVSLIIAVGLFFSYRSKQKKAGK